MSHDVHTCGGTKGSVEIHPRRECSALARRQISYHQGWRQPKQSRHVRKPSSGWAKPKKSKDIVFYGSYSVFTNWKTTHFHHEVFFTMFSTQKHKPKRKRVALLFRPGGAEPPSLRLFGGGRFVLGAAAGEAREPGRSGGKKWGCGAVPKRAEFLFCVCFLGSQV